MDIYSLIREFRESGAEMQLARDPRVQFGRENRIYKFAPLLPELNKPENSYTETSINYKTIVANDGSRYSEPQMKAGELVGEFDVKFGEIDIAAQLTGREFDEINNVTKGSPDAGRRQLTNWYNTRLNLGLKEKKEAQRGQAIVNAAVPIVGTDGKTSTVFLANPPGHRVSVPSGTTAAPAGWYDQTGNYDPWDDFIAAQIFMSNKGYRIGRIMASTQLVSVLCRNRATKERVGMITYNASNQPVARVGAASKDSLNAELQSDGMPAIETYDLQYFTQNGSQFFLPRNAIVFMAATLRNQEIDLGDQGFRITEDVLGYYGVGRAVGQDEPGDVIKSEMKDLKPVGVYAQAFSTGFAVVTEPESIYVIFVNPPTQV